MDGWMGGWVGGWVGGLMGWMDGWVDKWIKRMNRLQTDCCLVTHLFAYKSVAELVSDHYCKFWDGMV